jgi:protocatechuate 3,4-dioxygenase beta subunit
MWKTLALAIFGLLGGRSAPACGCLGPTPVCSVYWNTPLLFLGHVVRIEHVYDKPPEERDADGKKITITGPGQYWVHFDVTRSYRGAPGEQVVIHTPDQNSSCGYAFQQGRDYLVYSDAMPNGDFTTTPCSRTHEVTSRPDDEDIQWIESLPKAPHGGSIFGRIQSRQPNELGGYSSDSLAGVPIAVTGPDAKSVASNAEGKFRVEGLAPGKYTVSAVAPRQYAAFSDSTVTIEDRSCAEVDWSTQLDGHIRGHVYFSDGTPAAGIYLTTKSADAQPHESWTWRAGYATTTSDGGFDFGKLAAGSYVLAANMDFAPQDGKPYYRRSFYPGSAHRSEAAIITVDAGEAVDNLRFFLPPDSLPTIPLELTVLGFDGRPVSHAAIVVYDETWENLVTAVSADADEHGKATITLRSGSHYDIEAVATSPDSSQACAEPLRVDAEDRPVPLVLVLSHHAGNCLQFKKPRP